MNRALLILVGTIAFTVIGCRSSEDSASKEKEMTEMQKPADPGPGVPPGHCRVVAEVVRIDECAEPPCTGVVKISEVLGYGSAFNAPLPKGSEIGVIFAKSVKDLRQGSIFQADLASANLQIKDSKEKPSFTVSSYTLR